MNLQLELFTDNETFSSKRDYEPEASRKLFERRYKYMIKKDKERLGKRLGKKAVLSEEEELEFNRPLIRKELLNFKFMEPPKESLDHLLFKHYLCDLTEEVLKYVGKSKDELLVSDMYQMYKSIKSYLGDAPPLTSGFSLRKFARVNDVHIGAYRYAFMDSFFTEQKPI